MYHEILDPEQAAETTAWWRQAFLALREPVPDEAESTDPEPDRQLPASGAMEQHPQNEAG